MNIVDRAKSKYEIAVLDHKITNRKKSFGVQLYNLISKQHKQHKQNATNKSSEDSGILEAIGSGLMEPVNCIMETPGIFKQIEFEIKEPLDSVHTDIRVLRLEKKNVQKNIENAPLGLGGWWMCQWIRIKLLNREIVDRKGQFGLEAFDIVCSHEWMHEAMINETKDASSGLDVVTGVVGGLVSGIKGTVSNVVENTRSAVSAEEREILDCVNEVKEDVKSMEKEKKDIEKSLAAIGKQ